MRLWQSALAVTAALIAVAACAPKEGEVGGDGGAVKMGGNFAVVHIGPYVAWKKGFFEKHGVKVQDYIFTAGGSETFQAVVSGNLDFGFLSHEAVVRGQEQGLDVRSIGAVYPEFWALQVSNDLRDQVDSIKDLKGRKVGVSKVGSGSWAFLSFYAAQQGLDPQRDLEILQLGGISNIVTALRSGKIDAAVTWEPGTSQMLLSDVAFNLVDLHSVDDQKRVFGVPNTLSQVVAAKESVLKNNPDMARGVVAGLADAYKWIHESTPEEVADVFAPMAPSVDRKVIMAAVERYLPLQPKSPDVSKSAYEASMTALQKSGVLSKVLPVEEVFACEFAGCVR